MSSHTTTRLACDAGGCEAETDAVQSTHGDDARLEMPEGWRSVEEFDYCPDHSEGLQPYQCCECEWIFVRDADDDEAHACPGCEHPNTVKIDWHWPENETAGGRDA